MRGTTLLLLLSVCAHGQGATPSSALPDAPVAKPVPIDIDTPADKRVLGVLPNYRTSNPYSVYQPLTMKQKLMIGVKDSFDYPLLFLGGALAGLDQLKGSDPSYGQGVRGFAQRYAADYGDQMFGNLMTEGFMPVLLHQDPRYFRMSTGSIGKRTLHALSNTFVTHDDSGKLDFNYSEWVGNSVAVAISQSYHFDDRNAHSASEKLVEQCGLDALTAVLKEFWPDIKRKVFKKSQGTP
jgi:hypothetical protein